MPLSEFNKLMATTQKLMNDIDKSDADINHKVLSTTILAAAVLIAKVINEQTNPSSP